jgi:hypothetical protein
MGRPALRWQRCPAVVLAPIVAGLVVGCRAQCRQEADRQDVALYVTWEQLASVLDEQGRFTPDACASLCSGYVYGVETVHGCVLPDEPVQRPTTADTGVRDDTSDTAPPASLVVFEIACDVTATAVCVGRHHASVASRRAPALSDPVARYLAGAWLGEATSVQAFLALAEELEGFGAPDALIARARASAVDEVVHARLVAALAPAAARGVPTFRATPRRDLLAFAVENAVEGCVRETFAALVAAHQSTAASAAFGPAFARIAADEIRHAELAWAIHEWAMRHLSPDERAAVASARETAIDALYQSVDEPDRDLVALGLPSAAASRRLLDGLVAALWARARPVPAD